MNPTPKKILSFPEIKALHPDTERNFDRLIERLVNDHLIGSTLVEGSTFTELEAQRVLQGETIHGHVIDEHLELTQGRDAASYLHRMFFQREQFTVSLIDHAHRILFTDVGHPTEKTPGMNRGQTGLSASTYRLADDAPTHFEYANPVEVKETYQGYLDFHLNQYLPQTRAEAVQALAMLYFQFQMIHPYTDGNGRIGRLLVSGKVASEKGWFFRFCIKDGPEHLSIVMSMTGEYQGNKDDVDYSPLIGFLDNHLEEL